MSRYARYGSQSNATVEKYADNIYLNIVINGNQPKYNPNPVLPPTGEEGIIADFNVVKSEPYLDKPSDYYCSVIRYVIPLQLIPLFIMPIIPNQPDPDNSTLLFGMIYLNQKYPQYVEYFPDNVLNPPQQNLLTQVITPYYYVYTYSHMIQMVNETLNIIWNTKINIPANNPPFPGQSAPFFSYNPVTQLITLVVPNAIAVGTVSLYMNTAALQFFEGFHLSFYGYNQPNGEDYVFIFNTLPSSYYPTPGIAGPSPQAYQLTQDYNTLYYWNSLRKIILTSTSIPINSEIIPANLNGEQQIQIQPAAPGKPPIPLLTPANSGGQQYTAFPIITDYIISSSNAGDSRSIALYIPQSQYRLLDMSGDSPISAVDIKAFWSDIKGDLYPIYIPQNQQMSVKIGFFRKELYKNTINMKV
jgi:hypothetical protein